MALLTRTLLALLLLASPATAGRRDADDRCLRLAAPGEAKLPGKIFAVQLAGAATLSDDLLWELVGGEPELPLSRDQAIALVARFAQSGLFSSVEPRTGQASDELELVFTEQPQVFSVELRGLSEFRSEDVLDRLLDAPTASEVKRRSSELQDARASDCPAPLPPREWLAHVEEGQVRGGILWQGLRPALQRVLRYLRSRGYPLARLQGKLTPEGVLQLDLDEGHLGRVEVRGVDSHIASEVAAELGLQRGEVFSTGELSSALERVQRRWPFLRADRQARSAPPVPTLRLEQRPGGTVAFSTDDVTLRRDDDDEQDDFPRSRAARQVRGWFVAEGSTLVVYLRSERASSQTQWQELIRHTPVTGFAPGVATTLTLYDPGDRTHLLLDGALNFNTRRSSQDASSGSYLERLNAKQRVDELAGLRLRLPALGIAELGAQLHSLTDTADKWRMSAIDSYLYSALLNHADREYFRRSGYAAFVTFQLFEELTLGAEYRRDVYAHLDAPPGVWALFNKDDPRYGAALVDEGEMGSALFRFEYRSEKSPLWRVGSMWRDPEVSLVDAEPGTLGLRTLNTVEVADPSLGGSFKFTRVVSDTSVSMELGRHDTLTLRLRGAGGHDLPLQKQEALGGWSALRGYDFKEFRGDVSALGTLQLEGQHFGAFLDVGSVKSAGAWLDPKTSAGATFSFGGGTRAEAAWRLDGHGRLTPDFRILFAVHL